MKIICPRCKGNKCELCNWTGNVSAPPKNTPYENNNIFLYPNPSSYSSNFAAIYNFKYS